MKTVVIQCSLNYFFFPESPMSTLIVFDELRTPILFLELRKPFNRG